LVLSAEAQSTASSESAETIQLEEFTVTGSHIPTTETAFDARSMPVDIIGRNHMEQLGVSTAEELLQTMPYTQASVPISNNQTGFTPAASSVNLRGLGSGATLVLLNGRRVAPYPRGTGGTVAFVDITSFPLAAIEQVEVLKDGASATYGADAIAGVVNIKTRKRFNGAEATVRYGNTTSKDSGEIIANIIGGASTENTNMVFGLNYYRRNDIFNSDREYSAVPPFLSSNSSPLNFEVTRAAVNEALNAEDGGSRPLDALFQGAPESANFLLAKEIFKQDYINQQNLDRYAVWSGTVSPPSESFLDGFNAPIITVDGLLRARRDVLFTSTWTNRDQNNGNLPASAYDLSRTRPSSFNFNEFSQSYPASERKGGFATIEKRILGTENVYGYGEVFFQMVDAVNELAPSATGNFRNPGGVPLVIPARTPNPILTPSEQAAGKRTAAEGAYNPFNPFNQDFSGGTRARLAEFGNRIYRTTNTAFNAAAGLRGEKVMGNWNWDLNGYYSQIRQATRNTLVSITKFNRINNAADPIFDPTSDQYIGTTIPYNPFGYFRNEIENNKLVAPFALVELKDRRESELYGGSLAINNPELFELPGGSAGFAAGVEYRFETMLQSPDEAGSSGDVIGSSTDNATNADREIGSIYAEMNIPIFGEDNAVPGAYRLNLNIAGRFEDFVTQNDSIFVPKVALRWMPVDDSFVIRGTWGQGYRQPSMYELYAEGLTYALAPITDPVTQVNEPEQDVSSASNRRLKAEESDNFTVGFVWTPEFLRKDNQAFSVGVDYWYIKRTGNVTVDYQDVVFRDFNGDPLLPGESVQRDAAGNIVLVNAIFRNIGNEKAKGLDIQASYFYVTENWGRFDFRLDASYLDSYKIQQFPSAPFFEYKGEMTDILFDNQTGDSFPGSGDDGYLEWRGRASLSWSKGPWNASLNARYTDGFRDFKSEWDPRNPNDPAGFRQVASRTIFDVVVGYTFFEGQDSWMGDTRVVVGVDNILDTDPPFVSSWDNNSTGYPGFLYTAENRFYYISLTKKL